MRTPRTCSRERFRVQASALILAIGVLWAPGHAQTDICGCTGSPSPGAFDTLDPATYPAGTQSSFRNLVIPLPEDGIFVFDSFNIAPRPSDNCLINVGFQRNPANTPVTILVKGNVTISGTNCTDSGLYVSAAGGSSGTTQSVGFGGLGGPGGLRGGDGAYQAMNGASDGGAGFGPGGGAGATASPFIQGGRASFIGSPDLVPLLGGSGGGGGASNSSAAGCAGGGGGGGGGAILIAANGTITVGPFAYVAADGAGRGDPSSFSCASRGGGGSGGAIRLVAHTITGNGFLGSRGGRGDSTGDNIFAPGGRIRMESIVNSFIGTTDPVAFRATSPGPLVSPLNPSVRITSINGVEVPVPPQGGYGAAVDVVIPAPTIVPVNFATSGVPTNTTVEVTVKPRVGPPPQTTTATLTNCDSAGNCLGTVSFNLIAGTYVVEARATFAVQ
jgi:hypothetical protein